MNEQIEISKIEVSKRVNRRCESVCQVTVARYMEVAELPPVDLFLVDHTETKETQGLYLTDGLHRLIARKNKKEEMIPFRIVGRGTFRDAMKLGCLANINHGLPLTGEQLREQVLEYSTLDPQATVRDLEKIFNVHYSTISRWIKAAKEGGVDQSTPRGKANTDKAMLTLRQVLTVFTRWKNKSEREQPFENWGLARLKLIDAEMEKIVQFRARVQEAIATKSQQAQPEPVGAP